MSDPVLKVIKQIRLTRNDPLDSVLTYLSESIQDFDEDQLNTLLFEMCDTYGINLGIINFLIQEGANPHSAPKIINVISDELNRLKDDKLEVQINFLTEFIQYLSKEQLNELLVKICVYFTDLELIKVLIEAGADPRYKDDKCFINICGDSVKATFFLDLGADINAQGGKCLFKLSGGDDRASQVKFLLDHGANITEDAIEQCIEYSNYTVIEVFLEHDQSEENANLILKLMMNHIRDRDEYHGRMFRAINKKNPDYQKVISELEFSDQF